MTSATRGIGKSVHSPDQAAFCELMVGARKAAGLTQHALALRLKKPQSFVAKYEGGERRLDVVEKLIPLAAEAGLPMTHLAMAFTIAHPGVTSALIGVRTMDHLDGLLTGLDVTLTDDILDRIDEIVPPGTDVGTLDQAYQPPALELPSLRRRPLTARAAA